MTSVGFESKCEELLAICEGMVSEMKEGVVDDLEYMCQVFFLRQIQHMGSILKLKGECDSQLISRSMFEGALYLMYAKKDRRVARRWRLYCVVVDKQRMDEADLRGVFTPLDVREMVEGLLPECDELFKGADGEYAQTWREGESIHSIVKKVGFERLYDEYYYPMSDYHHWGTVSVGKRYAISDGRLRVVDSSVTDSDRVSALLLAISCLLSSADLANFLLRCSAKDILGEFKSSLFQIPSLVVNTIPVKENGFIGV